MPHRRRDGLGRREERVARAGEDDRRTHLRKHRIALAFVAAARGYGIILTMPETMSVERRQVLKAFGARLVLTEGAKGMKGAIAKAEEIVASDPSRHYLPQQFKNPANPWCTRRRRGPEIWEDTNGAIDVLVSGVGTGGTITGISRYNQEHEGEEDHLEWRSSRSTAPCLRSNGTVSALVPGPHKIQGLGAGSSPMSSTCR